MLSRRQPWLHLLVACALACAFVPGARAQGSLGFQVHGFGGWYYGESSELQFLGAVKDGSAENSQFALNVASTPADRVTIIAQVNLERDQTGTDVKLDYAFVNYDLTGRLKVRAGRLKHPWGIYGEIFDVGTARPFQHLSQAVYGPVGFTAKAYNGFGFTGSMDSDGGWGLQYDVYGGEIDGDYEDTGLLAALSGDETDIPQKSANSFRDKKVVGTRLQLNTPVDGLWVGVSAYTGDEVPLGVGGTYRKSAYLGSLEYVTDRFLLRAESGHFQSHQSYRGDATYAEVAYKFTPHWQIAGRWDDFNLHLTAFAAVEELLPPYLLSRIDEDHNERVIGLNYWINANVVIRASYSRVTGDRLLFPTAEQLQTLVDTGVKPKDESNVILIGTQFSF